MEKMIYLVLLIFSFNISATTIIEKINNLLLTENFTEAYNLAKSVEDSELGDPKFDYLYALSALESNHAAEAIFPLERILMEEPNQYKARLELGRAYYLLGDNKTAKSEFYEIKSGNPNLQVIKNVDLYLNAIENKLNDHKTTFLGMIGYKLGYNSNINSATSNNSIILDILGSTPVNLDSNSKKINDNYSEKNISLMLLKPFSNKYKSFITITGSDAVNFTHGPFDLGRVMAQVGIIVKHDKYEVRLPVDIEKVFLDNHRYQLNKNISMSLGSKYKTYQYSLNVKYGRSDFNNSPMQSNKIQLYNFGLNKTLEKMSMLLSSSVFHTKTLPKYNLGLENTYRNIGFRIGVIKRMSPNLSSYLNLDYTNTIYNYKNSIFLKKRHDKKVGAYLGILYKWIYGLQLKTEISKNNNNSNIDINTYRQIKYYIGAEYVF